MRVVIQEKCEELYNWTANRIKNAILNHKGEKPFVLGISLCKETTKVLEKLVEFYEKGELSFQKVRVLLAEEFIDMAEDNPENNISKLKKVFLDKIDIKKLNVVSFTSHPSDKEPTTIQNCLKVFGGIDILLCELGLNGRLALNEPFSSLKSRCRMSILSEVTRSTIAEGFTVVPKMGCTIGLADILDAREAIVFATGNVMADAVKTTVEGPVSMSWPASSLSLHNNAILAVDDVAASKLETENKRFFAAYSTIDL